MANGWKAVQLKVRNGICYHIADTYTGIKGSKYLDDTKMKLLTTEGIDVVLMEAGQLLGVHIYIYHK